MATGLAGKLKLELATLAQRHGVAPPAPIILPPAPASMDDVAVEGFAATRNMPLDRIMLRGWCFPILPWEMDKPKVRLLYKHKDDEVAGTIQRLAYDDHGQLKIKANITHPFAKLCGGFSVSAKILAYEMRETDDPKRFHAFVTNAELDEISLTNEPADPTALITRRGCPSSVVKNFDIIQKQLANVQALVAALPPHLFAAAPVREPPTTRRHPTVGDTMHGDAFWADFPKRAPKPKPRTSFGELADHLRNLEA
jgi:hypothetical protein